MSSTLAASGALKPDANAVSVLTRFVRYFAAIRFWQDEDSGHWEEQRKVSASSIGTVVAGLEAFADLLRQRDAILPGECAQLVGSKNRRYDAALLFLLFPLGVITDETMADLVLHDVSKLSRGSRETGLSFQSLARADH